MQPDTARRRTETPSSWGTAVAACHSFLLHQREGWAFDPTDPALHRQWHAEGEQLRGSTFDDVLTMAARAWPIEMVPQQTDVAVSLPSGRVYFFGEPLIMGDQEEEEEEEEERIYLAWQSASSRPPPLVFHTQDAALTAADAMPPGFLWVWARDKPAEPKPTKQYLVASLDDFWAYYFQLPSPATRCYYELIRVLLRRSRVRVAFRGQSATRSRRHGAHHSRDGGAAVSTRRGGSRSVDCAQLVLAHQGVVSRAPSANAV